MRWFVNAILFLIPFVVFFAYARWANARRAASGEDPLKTPWFWLIVLAMVVGISGFFVLRAAMPQHTGIYVPARVGPDGKLIPGHFEGNDNQPAHVIPPDSPPPPPPEKP